MDSKVKFLEEKKAKIQKTLENEVTFNNDLDQKIKELHRELIGLNVLISLKFRKTR